MPSACVHCRAEAIPRRDPDELSTDEGKRLLDRVRAFGDPPPILVLSGGDPLRRADIAELVAYGTRIGLSVSLTPSGTAAVMATGNVRVDDLVTVYRENPLFLALRDPARLGGRCGCCEYRDQCGGSRARAHALTGNVLAEDPGCAYQPRGDAPSAPLLAIPAIAGGSDAPIGVSREQVMQSLGTVFDPELGMSIVDLGLVYGVEVDGTRVAITMTLTAPGCPIHDAMSEWVQQAVMKVPGVSDVDVTITFDPSWTPDRIRPGLLT